MLIDTIGNTITFKYGEKLHPSELHGAIEAIGAQITVHVDLDLPQWEIDLLTSPFKPFVTKVRSQTKDGVYYYIIEAAPGVFTCTCPDFIHHRASLSQWCKHITEIHKN